MSRRIESRVAGLGSRVTPEAIPDILIDLASKGRGRVAPNPMVGALIELSGRIITTGFHREFGGPHAERAALAAAGARARGATLHSSLEPCAHQGKTPPCTTAIIEAGIKRVVFYSRDPNPKVRGKAARLLAKAGVRCEFRADDEPRFRLLNFGYDHWIRTRRPFVTLKACASLDGRIADFTGRANGLGNARQQHAVHLARAEHDAVLVGIGTVLKDDPRLNVRGPGSAPQPARIVLDRELRLPLSARILSATPAGPLIVVCDPASARGREARALAACGARLLPVAGRGRPFLRALLSALGEAGITSLLVEGGATVLGEFLNASLGDLLLLYQMPVFLGEHGVPLAKLGKSRLTRKWDWRFANSITGYGYLELLPSGSPFSSVSEFYP